ncbi:metal ABC transporter substrate-binding protein [Telmatospirillum siberiense]|uniref:Metal ABC transporter substrate-binding protein n=1 Tax=Telmatospirillum siberiense TaxID=382514 RepID=A0A2N3PQE8_9PROT|nr:metal ABC transporter substrate-binding protein [Telmatospirillum siberiense]PKU22629.1 metal ABC transporter substrate-binding protein [Telmatospirillum siberiense]
MNGRLLRRSAAAAAMILLALTSAASAAPLKVVATFSIIGDLVKTVGGDGVSLTTLVAPGGDAHVYEPTPQDAKTIAGADLVVVNGLGMEGWIDRLIAASGYHGKILVASDGIAPQTMVEEEDGAKDGKRVTDPHAWQNLANGRIYVRNIAKALAEADPAGATGYAERAGKLDGEIAALDAWVRRQMAEIPSAKRKIITSHDAFGYFGAAYGVTFLAPVGLSTESEPTAAGLGQLTRQIKKEGIKALFIESMSDPRLIRQLARESGAVVGGTLYSDTLSKEGGPADTYLKMFRNNVPAMVEAMRRN